MKQFMSVNETHKAFGLPINRLREWIAAGRCPGFRSGNRYYIDSGALLELIEAGAFSGKEVQK